MTESVASLQNSPRNNILLWQLVLRYQPLIDGDIITFDEAVLSASIEYYARREMCAVPKHGFEALFGPVDPDYSCGAAYCADPACNTHNRSEH